MSSLKGPDVGLARLIERLEKIPGMTPQFIADAVPTLRKLLQNNHNDVEPRPVPYAARRYDVSPSVQERIDQNTHVWAEGSGLHVGTFATDERGKHLRPLVPVGDELPMRWRRAIAAKVNGQIRKYLKGQSMGPGASSEWPGLGGSNSVAKNPAPSGRPA